jgi:hypothetical protein
MPERVQRKRTTGFKLPPNTVCVTRGTKYGNPFKIGDPHPVTGEPMTGDQVIHLHEQSVDAVLAEDPDYLEPLRGRNVACFCSLSSRCHADTLLRKSNQ